MPKNSSAFKRIAHRGASREAPENTIPALRLAVEKYKVDMIEIDLRLSKEGVPVILHDETLERTTDGECPVGRFTLHELKTRDAGFRFDPDGKKIFPYRGKGVTIPTLEEVLSQFPGTSFCLEIKETDLKCVERILAVIQKIPRRGSLIIGSFHGRIAREVRRQSIERGLVERRSAAGSSAPQGLSRSLKRNMMEGTGTARLARRQSVERRSAAWSFGTARLARRQAPSGIESFLALDEVRWAYLLFRLGFKKFSPPARYASLPLTDCGIRLDDPRWISFLHRQGVQVFYWTVDEPDQMETLIERGADGIVTNHPERLQQILL